MASTPNENSETDAETDNDLTLFNVLISVFIKEPKNIIFRSYGESIQDSHGSFYSLNAEDGIAYINVGKIKRKKEVYKKIITLSEENNFEYDKNSNQEKINTIIDKLVEYSQTLKSITEEINDITISSFSLKWGIKNENGNSPCLIDCEHSKFTFNEESKPFSSIHADMLLFMAFEISKVPAPGACFVGGQNCMGGDMYLPREKIISSKLLKFINNHDDIEDKSSFVKYIKNQLNQFCPSVLNGTVPLCKRCFNHYMVNTKLTSQALKKQDNQETQVVIRQRVPSLRNRGNFNNEQTLQQSSRRNRSQSTQATQKLYPDATRSLQKYRNSNNPIVPSQDPRTLSANRYNVNERKITPSGLILSHHYHDKSMSQAFGVYSKLPFPAFFRNSTS